MICSREKSLVGGAVLGVGRQAALVQQCGGPDVEAWP